MPRDNNLYYQLTHVLFPM